MTKDIFFDTDAISAFMWVRGINVVEELFGGNIVLTDAVYEELSNPVVPHLKAAADKLIDKGAATIGHIEYGSNAYYLYRGLNEDFSVQ